MYLAFIIYIVPKINWLKDRALKTQLNINKTKQNNKNNIGICVCMYDVYIYTHTYTVKDLTGRHLEVCSKLSTTLGGVHFSEVWSKFRYVDIF